MEFYNPARVNTEFILLARSNNVNADQKVWSDHSLHCLQFCNVLKVA